MIASQYFTKTVNYYYRLITCIFDYFTIKPNIITAFILPPDPRFESESFPRKRVEVGGGQLC